MKIREKRIVLRDFLMVIRKYFLIMIAATVVFAGAGYILAARKVSETYTASSEIYVLTVTADMDGGISSTETALSRAIAAECKRIMLCDNLVKNVREHFKTRRQDSPNENWEDLSKYTDGEILSMIKVTNETNSQTIVIKVTASSRMQLP